MSRLSTFFFLAVLSRHYALGQQTTFLPSNAPMQWQKGQSGTNQCGGDSNPLAMCQNLYINAVDDFCLWGPPNAGPNADIGHSEREEVAWCLKDGYGTRLIPAGAITGAHFVQTPDFVQVTGIGSLSMINIPRNDTGGELDPHGPDGLGNPLGGAVFSNAFNGTLQQLQEWTMFISGELFCFRACKPGTDAARWCQHIYDVMGCAWNMPANYELGFDICQGDSGEPAGEYNGSTWYQGQPQTPPAHPRPSVSACSSVSSIGQAQATISGTSAQATTPSTSMNSGTSITPVPTASMSAVANGVRPGMNISGSRTSADGGWEHVLVSVMLVASSIFGTALML